MSLRVFHIIFVICCVALCAFVAAWGFREFLATRNGTGLALGILFLGAGAALVVYGVMAFRKLKELP